MAEDSVVVEARKLGEALIAAATVVKRAKELQTQIAGYETQADRLKETLTKDREALETLRTEIKDATHRLRVATEQAEGAAAERDRRLSIVAQEEETAIAQLRVLAQRDREQINRTTKGLLLEVETRKQQIQAELDVERRRLKEELDVLEANVEDARQKLRRAREAHVQFIESISVQSAHAEAQ